MLRGSNHIMDLIEKLHEPKVKIFYSFILLEGQVIETSQVLD